MPDSLPRPTTELFPEALNLSPKQREVLTAVPVSYTHLTLPTILLV